MASPQSKTKKNTSRKITSAAEWKKSSEAQEVELPSGNVALMKFPGLTALMSEGIFTDRVLEIVQGNIDKAQGRPKPQDHKTKKSKKADSAVDEGSMTEIYSDMMKDPKKMEEAFDSFDRALVRCVIQPEVLYYKYTEDTAPQDDLVGEKIPEDERDPEALYSDEVDIEDKMFVFNVAVGGSRDIERFRAESGEGVAALRDS